MNPSFVVSGFGRSGSKWLAEMANKSAVWTVEHEPSSEITLDAARARFAAGRSAGPYAEVNSNLLGVMDRLDVPLERQGVLLRCPRRIAVSCVRKGHVLTRQFLDYLNFSLAVIDARIDAGVRPISMHQMVTNLSYANELLRALGVEDVTLEDKHLAERINASEGRQKWSKWDAQTRNDVTETTDWFTRKHQDLLDTVSA